MLSGLEFKLWWSSNFKGCVFLHGEGCGSSRFKICIFCGRKASTGDLFLFCCFLGDDHLFGSSFLGLTGDSIGGTFKVGTTQDCFPWSDGEILETGKLPTAQAEGLKPSLFTVVVVAKTGIGKDFGEGDVVWNFVPAKSLIGVRLVLAAPATTKWCLVT